MALIITQAGLAALATAESTGSKLQATHMAVGDGNGQPVSHTSQSVELLGETWRGELQEIKVVDSGEVEFIAHIPFAVGGWYMREAAIYAADTLLAIGSHPEVWKPDPEAPDKVELLVTAPVKFTNTDVINLTVDTTKVLASQEMVVSAVAQHNEDDNAHAGALSALKNHPTDPTAHELLFQAMAQAIANHAGAEEAHAALFQAIINQLPGNASTSVKGLVELATNAETQTGTESTRAVTPAGLSSLVSTLGKIQSLGTRSTTGTWTLTGVIVGKPLFFFTNSEWRESLTFKTIKGPLWSIVSGARYLMKTSRGVTSYSDHVAVVQAKQGLILPTSSTVVINISAPSSPVTAYQ